jgi:ubiquinone/menaquinone biosynthesis C-methylase UbiE
MQDRTFKGDIQRLRSSRRVEILEIERVIELCLETLYVTKVLDVGSGSGLFTEAFALRNLDVTGVDKDPQMVKTATDMVLDAHFREGSAEKLPFPGDSFDLVFLGHILHESNDPVAVLQEAARVATLRVAVLEWPCIKEEKGPPLEHRLEADTIKKLARKAGLTDFKTIKLEHMILFRMKPKNNL